MPESIVLPDHECHALLRAGAFGRLAFAGPEGPEIVPINYVAVGDAVLMRSSSTSLVAVHTDGAAAAFEVDGVDYARGHGWSVVAHGRCELVAPDGLSEEERRTPGPPAWVRRDGDLWIRLRWTSLTGRRLGTGWSPLAEMPVRRMWG